MPRDSQYTKEFKRRVALADAVRSDAIFVWQKNLGLHSKSIRDWARAKLMLTKAGGVTA